MLEVARLVEPFAGADEPCWFGPLPNLPILLSLVEYLVDDGHSAAAL